MIAFEKTTTDVLGSLNVKFNKKFAKGEFWRVADYTVEYDLRDEESSDISKIVRKAKWIRKKFDGPIFWANAGDCAYFWLGDAKEITKREKDHRKKRLEKMSQVCVFSPSLPPTLEDPKEERLFCVRIGNPYDGIGVYDHMTYQYHVKGDLFNKAMAVFEKYKFNQNGVPKDRIETFTGSCCGYVVVCRWDTYSGLWKDGSYKLLEEKDFPTLEKDLDLFVKKNKIYLARLREIAVKTGEIGDVSKMSDFDVANAIDHVLMKRGRVGKLNSMVKKAFRVTDDDVKE